MAEYKNGDRVRVTIEGTVTNLIGGDSFTLVDKEGEENLFAPSKDDSVVEVLAAAYEVGAVYVDADGDVFMRVDDAAHPWRGSFGDEYNDGFPTNPLRPFGTEE